MVIASHEDGETFSEIFKSLDVNMKYLLADGSKAITLGKQAVWPNENEVVDEGRLMCFPHVDRAASKKRPKAYSAEMKRDIDQLQLSQTRQEFDAASSAFITKVILRWMPFLTISMPSGCHLKKVISLSEQAQ